MDYPLLQGFGLDGQLMEERNLSGLPSGNRLFQRPAHILPVPSVSLSAPDLHDPLLLQTKHAWFTREQIPPAGNLGFDTSGHSLPHQRPNIIMQSRHLNTPEDMTTAASSESVHFRFDVLPPYDQCRQMCPLSSDEYLSDSTVQQPCLYSSSSDCAHDADSSGSSERGKPLSRSCLVGSPDETNWRVSDVLQPNLGHCSTAGFHSGGLPSDSSIAADLDTLDSSRHTLRSLASMPGPAGDCIPLQAPASWMFPRRIGPDNEPIFTNLLKGQHIPNMDSFGSAVCTRTNNPAPPYKRQRTSHKAANSSVTRSFSKPVIAPLSSRSSTKSSAPEYPMAPSNITGTLYKDTCVPRRQTTFWSRTTVVEAEGGPELNSGHLHNGLKCHRKNNAPSIEPQSVAARHRRRKISERVRVLEKLIPGGNKMDTASMLDESIEYVKFLQLQVHLLESLGDISCASNSAKSTPSHCNNPIGNGGNGLDMRTFDRFASQASERCSTMQMMVTASPLVLSEILQQQLFKQKLCLVSLRQCPPTTPSRSYA